MKFRKPIWLIFSAVIISLAACNAPGKVVKLSKTQNIVFLDSLSAASAIVDDDTEGFFEKINVLDMSIQMKRNFATGTSRGEIVEAYKNYLAADVSSFSDEEKKLLKSKLKKAYKQINKIAPGIFPLQIELIKTQARHYGPGTYYTRENRIIIPKDALATKGKDKSKIESALYKTLLHEIFHIYSRYNERQRRQLYGLVGFRNIFGLPLLMNDALKERILLNPDGLDIAQVIDIQKDSSKISAIPIIISSEPRFEETKEGFFHYLKFDLYQILKVGQSLKILTNDDGTSRLNLKELPDYFRQIKDNTQYIIHPDEIMADNFALLVLSQTDGKVSARLSPEGKKLLKDMKSVLQGKELSGGN